MVLAVGSVCKCDRLFSKNCIDFMEISAIVKVKNDKPVEF